MEEKTLKCNSCGQPMLEIGEIGKTIQIDEINKNGLWEQTEKRSVILYQCPDCKDVKID